MALRSTTLIALSALASLSIACGSTAAPDKSGASPVSPGGTDAGGGTGGEGCGPGMVQMGGACISLGPAGQPCKTAIHTAFDGDTQCLEAPDPATGMQLHYGPSNYDDPAEIAKFTIDPGSELVDCMFMKTPNATDTHVDDYHIRLRPGTHHMITYVQPQVVADSAVPGPCNQGPGFTFLTGATTINTDIATAGKNPAPEYDGVAEFIRAKSQVAVQMHFINTTDKPRLKEGWINALYVTPDKVKMEVNPVTWLGGLGMSIKPHTVTTTAATCSPLPAGPDMDIISLVAHMHSHTTRVAAFIQRAGATDRTKVYEDYNWEEPTFIYYNTTTKNPMWDPVAKRTGGLTGDLIAHPGDTLSWECEVHNDGPNDNLTLQFSDKALTGEMCNVFGVFGPANQDPKNLPTQTIKPWACYSL